MKKLLALLLAIIMVFAFAACAAEPVEDDDEDEKSETVEKKKDKNKKTEEETATLEETVGDNMTNAVPVLPDNKTEEVVTEEEFNIVGKCSGVMIMGALLETQWSTQAFNGYMNYADYVIEGLAYEFKADGTYVITPNKTKIDASVKEFAEMIADDLKDYADAENLDFENEVLGGDREAFLSSMEENVKVSIPTTTVTGTWVINGDQITLHANGGEAQTSTLAFDYVGFDFVLENGGYPVFGFIQ